MKKTLLLLTVSLVLLLCACKNSEESKTQEIAEIHTALPITVECDFDVQRVEDFLQGTWTYFDTAIGSKEEYYFDRGNFGFITVLEAAPNNPHTSEGSYEIFDGYIELYFPKTDYTNTISYNWLGEELVLYWYIDSGADKGNTRVFQKQDTQTPGFTVEQAPAAEQEHKSTPFERPAEKSTSQNVTSGMRNALRSAESYLSVMPFSYKGLIEQLEYEGYSYSEAKYAADNCGANWKEQAVKCAENYLDIMPFSRSALIEQLEYEGFTYEQASYGVNKAY